MVYIHHMGQIPIWFSKVILRIEANTCTRSIGPSAFRGDHRTVQSALVKDVIAREGVYERPKHCSQQQTVTRLFKRLDLMPHHVGGASYGQTL